MNPLVLLAAGFSRNWGGWIASEVFEYLLGCPEITRSNRLRALLWKHQPTGGFEDALAEVQADHCRNPSASATDLHAMQTAIGRMFDDMNHGYAQSAEWEFQQHQHYMVRTFLSKFNAIFSLNQDLLLELRYLNDNIMLGSNRKWAGWQLPGLRQLPNQEWKFGNTTANGIWIPEGILSIHAKDQPLFKLHGSSNWRDQAGSSLLVMGGNKAQEINAHPILNSYMQQFEEYLSRANTRLMIIGYGFRDPHINTAISTAVARGLRFFIINPRGSGLARSLNPTRQPGMIGAQTSLEDLFEAGLIGASQRSLREIFGGNTVEHAKVMRFFDI